MSPATFQLLLQLLTEHRASLIVARRLAAAQLGAGHHMVGQYAAQLKIADTAEDEIRGECEVAA